MDPPRGHIADAVPVVIHGKNFFAKVKHDLTGQEEFTVDDRFVAVLRLDGASSENEEVTLDDVRYVEPVRLTATVRSGIDVGVYELVVTDPYGHRGSLAKAYTATDQNPPEIEWVSPQDVVNDAETSLLVHGAGFVSGLALRLGDEQLAVQAVTDTDIHCVAPAGLPAKSYAVAVRNPDGQQASLDDAVTVHEPAAVGMELLASPTEVDPEEPITLTLSVSNQGGTAAEGLCPTEPEVSGDGSVQLVSGPDPASTDLDPTHLQRFVWTYQAVGAGEVIFSVSATGTNQYSQRPVQIGPVSSEPVRIRECSKDADCANPTPICGPAGRCAECGNDAECADRDPATPHCDTFTGSCLPCLSSADCGGNFPICDSEGVCVACTVDEECSERDPSFPYCAVSNGACVACLTAEHCSSEAPHCSAGSCVVCMLDDHCQDANPCTTSETCVGGACLPGPADKDADGDGRVDLACGGDDCDDDPAVCGASCRPGLVEVCDGFDNDCSAGVGADEVDADGDSIMICEGDCDDTCDVCWTGHVEECDGFDNDCDGSTDPQDSQNCVTYHKDADGDTYGVDGDSRCLCTPSAVEDYDTTTAGDCDDDPAECGADCYPGNLSPDICDGYDQDCDHLVDEDGGSNWYHDADGDGYTNSADTQTSCTDPDGPDINWVGVPTPDDCDDTRPEIHHGSGCDDAEPCTAKDTCLDGTCRGYSTNGCGTCSGSCSGGCGAGNCCVDSCVGTCPTCEGGCSCDQTCSDSGNCRTTCLSGSVCHFLANNNGGAVDVTCVGAACFVQCENNGTDCTIDCQENSVCELACNNNGGDCELTCADTASCLMDCSGIGGTCRAICTNPVNCGGGVRVCNRPCP